MDLVSFLASIPFFRDLSPEIREELSRIIVERECGKDQMVFTQGEKGEGFYVVVSGRVKVFKLSAQGKSQVLGIIEPGEPLGEVAVFEGKSYPAYAQTLEESKLLFFPRKAFVKLIGRDSSLALGMLAVLSRRLRHLTGLAEDLSLREVPGRLASYLLRVKREGDHQETLELRVSKGQLAEVLGTTPESISRALARLSALGLIEVKGTTIKIKDPLALRELAYRGGRRVR